MADQFLVDVPGEVGGRFGPLCCTVGLYVLSRMIPPDNDINKLNLTSFEVEYILSRLTNTLMSAKVE